MKTDRFSVKLHSTNKINLVAAKVVGNGTIPASATPFPLRDTLYYQIDKHGDYTQEAN
jgi:hypothetical protein